MNANEVQNEVSKAIVGKLSVPNHGTISSAALQIGLSHDEPLIYGLVGAIRYAVAYRCRFESNLCNDYVLGPEFLKWITGLRGLLNGDGAVAMERGISTDSKDNGYYESLFWVAMSQAGFSEEDI